MVDHHVDRPEVKAGQPVELTGTNRSNERSIPAQASLAHQPPACSGKTPARGPTRHFPSSHDKPPDRRPLFQARGKRGGRPGGPGIAGLVAMARGQTPDPIPNSAVKTLCAHGTAAQAAEE